MDYYNIVKVQISKLTGGAIVVLTKFEDLFFTEKQFVTRVCVPVALKF